MEKISLYQLRLLEQQIDGLGRFSPRFVARSMGLSKSIVYQARYLINCQPVGWQDCLNGKRGITTVYRSCKPDGEI